MAHCTTLYEHTQKGPVSLWLAVGALVVAATLGSALAEKLSAAQALTTLAPGLVVLVVTYALFHSLRVVVDEQRLHAIFGVGILRFSYRLENIESARPVRNRWYWGWGIRMIQGGMLFNVAGLDAVELVLQSGGVRRIGSDEPEALARVIAAVSSPKRP